MSQSDSSPPGASVAAPAQRCAHVTSANGPGAHTLCRILTDTLARDGWAMGAADSPDANWHISISDGEATDAGLILADLRAFAARQASGNPRGIVLILDLRHAQPRPGDPAPPFSSALTQRTLAAAVPMLALEYAPRVRVNAIGILLPGPAAAPYPATPHADIAAALRFIIDAPALTGQMIALDSGRTALVPAPGLAPPESP